jgi:hypothetical protein
MLRRRNTPFTPATYFIFKVGKDFPFYFCNISCFYCVWSISKLQRTIVRQFQAYPEQFSIYVWNNIVYYSFSVWQSFNTSQMRARVFTFVSLSPPNPIDPRALSLGQRTSNPLHGRTTNYLSYELPKKPQVSLWKQHSSNDYPKYSILTTIIPIPP